MHGFMHAAMHAIKYTCWGEIILPLPLPGDIFAQRRFQRLSSQAGISYCVGPFLKPALGILNLNKLVVPPQFESSGIQARRTHKVNAHPHSYIQRFEVCTLLQRRAACSVLYMRHGLTHGGSPWLSAKIPQSPFLLNKIETPQKVRLTFAMRSCKNFLVSNRSPIE